MAMKMGCFFFLASSYIHFRLLCQGKEKSFSLILGKKIRLPPFLAPAISIKILTVICNYSGGAYGSMTKSDLFVEVARASHFTFTKKIIFLQKKVAEIVTFYFFFQTQDIAIRCIQKNVRKFMGVRDWHWWRLLIKLTPLLNVHRTEDQLKSRTVIMFIFFFPRKITFISRLDPK